MNEGCDQLTPSPPSSSGAREGAGGTLFRMEIGAAEIRIDRPCNCVSPTLLSTTDDYLYRLTTKYKLMQRYSCGCSAYLTHTQWSFFGAKRPLHNILSVSPSVCMFLCMSVYVRYGLSLFGAVPSSGRAVGWTVDGWSVIVSKKGGKFHFSRSYRKFEINWISVFPKKEYLIRNIIRMV